MKTFSLKKSPASRFQWENYCGNSWIEIEDAWNFGIDYPRNGYTVLGYIESVNLNAKPRLCGYAIMIEEDSSGEKCWFHIEPDEDHAVFSEIIK